MLHNVYFWLKPDLAPAERQLFEKELAKIAALDYLAYGFAGKPAPTEDRPVTDHSFSYCLALRFKSIDEHNFYQTECPAHLRFIETCKTLWTKVVVYDSESLT